jgi:hypothetical protein
MPVYLSASSISDFIKCPQRVLYRIKKTVKETKSKEMMIGLSMHHAIELAWDDRNKMLQILRSDARENKYSKSDFSNLSFMTDIFFLNFKQYLSENDKIEHSFKLPLYNDVFIVGKMDRIANEQILDWKTGRVPTRLDNDVQCIIYDWAYRKEFGSPPKGVCVASLQSGELIPYKTNTFYISELFEKVIPRMISVIKHDTYERQGLFNGSCFRCAYKVGCLAGGVKDELDNSITPE